MNNEKQYHKKIGIVGYGRFGKLWAHILAEAENQVFVYDPYVSNDSINISHHNIAMCEQSQLVNNDIVFFCVPISKLEKSVSSNVSFLSATCIVCDTCSVKEYPMEWMKKLLYDTHEIVGMHPLFGPDSVVQKYYKKVVVCRERISDEHYDMLCCLLKRAQLHVLEMTAKEHDTQSVFSQGLTHLIGRTLKKLPLKKEDVTTKGFEALLEIIEQTCKDSMDLFNDIQNYNKGSQDMWIQLQRALNTTLDEIRSAEHNNE